MTSFAKQHEVFSSRHAGTDVMLTIIGSLMLVVNFSDSPSAFLRLMKPPQSRAVTKVLRFPFFIDLWLLYSDYCRLTKRDAEKQKAAILSPRTVSPAVTASIS